MHSESDGCYQTHIPHILLICHNTVQHNMFGLLKIPPTFKNLAQFYAACSFFSYRSSPLSPFYQMTLIRGNYHGSVSRNNSTNDWGVTSSKVVSVDVMTGGEVISDNNRIAA